MSCVLTLPKTDIVFQARTFWLACVQTQAQSVQLVVEALTRSNALWQRLSVLSAFRLAKCMRGVESACRKKELSPETPHVCKSYPSEVTLPNLNQPRAGAKR